MTVLGIYRAELANTGFEAAFFQALSGLLINAGFFVILWATKSLIHYPCSLLKNQDLNQLAELVGTGATLAGSILSVIGSFSPNNQDLINVIGTFAIMNLSFVAVFVYGFYVDMKRRNAQALLGGGRRVDDDNNYL
ncbi:hypothetical protein TL16_g02227 [Triparma laevis f. inornata]|uniref:Uncharacterized protein n=2 Tax=Triparma laevis TaxID=1534972 RepID=A0A9W6ZDC5_9STRA|nr:hypothetical protein TrLO_g4520 [Triparma laevis f. longispina]GMH56816.1 hypothetical protein TL16_g02227 [Triparma laevis f. inornata]